MRDLLRKAYLENNGLCWQGRDQVRRQSAEFGTAGALGGPLASPADSKSQGRSVARPGPLCSPASQLLPRSPRSVAPAHDELRLQRVPRTINCCQTGETDGGGGALLADRTGQRGSKEKEPETVPDPLTLRRRESHQALLFLFSLFPFCSSLSILSFSSCLSFQYSKR